MIAQPPIPTVHQVHAATQFAYRYSAGAANGKIKFRDRCPVKNRSRVCHVRITGDAPQDLRIKVWIRPDGIFMIAARNWKK